MRAFVVHKAGGPEALQREEVETPRAREGWSVIEVKAFGINHSEIFTRKGLSPSVTFPRILGIECVGVIKESSAFAEGTRVVTIMGEMGRAYDGSYAQYVLVPDSQIYTVTIDLPWHELAAIPETGYTAFGSLKNLHITADDSILVRSAAAGVAITFVSLVRAKFPHIRIVGTTRNLNKADALKAQGYDDILEDTGVLETNEKFSKVLELVGPATVKDTIAHVSDGAIVCQSGQLGGQWYLEQFDPIMELAHNVYLTTFYSGYVDQNKMDELFAYIDVYHVHIQPQKVFDFEQLPDAHRYLESTNGFGKVVVRV